MRAGGGGSRLLERPGDVGRASRDRSGRRDVVDGPGFLPAEEGRFFLDLWSRTSVASRGTEAFWFPRLWMRGGRGEAGGKIGTLMHYWWECKMMLWKKDFGGSSKS